MSYRMPSREECRDAGAKLCRDTLELIGMIMAKHDASTIQAFMEEIVRLSDENAELKREIARMKA